VKERKYFFDLNKFDEPDMVEVEVEAPPPPPMFSLDELGHAKEVSFEEGRRAGLAEAEISRGNYIAHQMNEIAQSIGQLFDQEQYRQAQFEREVLSVAESAMQALFPALTRSHALAEIKDMIRDVLKREITAPHISIEVPMDDAEHIQNYVDQIKLDNKGIITVKADPNLSAGNCRILWKDGGAIRDHNAISREILRQLKPKIDMNEPNTAPVMGPTPLAQNNENDHNDEQQIQSETKTNEGE
jgi:flagellar assembly protein FliH